MRLTLLIVAATLLSTRLGQAQARPTRRVPRDGAAEIWTAVRPSAEALHLPPLATVPKSVAEIRAWYTAGLTEGRLVRIRRGADQRWRGERLALGAGASLRRVGPADTTDWTARVDQAIVEGLLRLPRAPHDTLQQLAWTDGWGVLIEWVLDGGRGSAGADDPARHCTGDDRQLLGVLAALVADTIACVGQPR